MTVVEGLGVVSLASPTHGLGSPIASELINVGGDEDLFVRFLRFSSNGVVDFNKPSQAERSKDHQVCTQQCVWSLGPFQSPLPYDLKTGILHKLLVAEGKCRKESSDYPMSWYGGIDKDPENLGSVGDRTQSLRA